MSELCLGRGGGVSSEWLGLKVYKIPLCILGW